MTDKCIDVTWEINRLNVFFYLIKVYNGLSVEYCKLNVRKASFDNPVSPLIICLFTYMYAL